MTPSLTLNRRYAILATLAFCVLAYELERTATAITGESLIPQTSAPVWAKIVFHVGLGAPAMVLCIFWATSTIMSMHLHITPGLTIEGSRNSIVSHRIRRHLPYSPTGEGFTVKLNRLDDWHSWGLAGALFLITALPYWVLLVLFGRFVAIGPLYLAFRAIHLLPWPITVTAGAIGLGVMVIRRHHRTEFVSASDKTAMALVSFIAGADQWSNLGRWRASALYSLWLQKRGIFPLLTLITAIPCQRLMISLYDREWSAGKTRDEALSRILTLRVMRIVVAAAFYAAVLVVKLWPHVW